MVTKSSVRRKNALLFELQRHWQLYSLLILPVAMVVIFKYGPIYGMQIAFRDYTPKQGMLGSPWVGLKHFINFFNDYNFVRVLRNTLVLNISTLLFSFPVPIILAIGINELRSKRYAKTVQTFTYIPHFISIVVMVGLIFRLVDPNTGPIGQLMASVVGKNSSIMATPGMFIPIYILSEIWQGAGYSAVIYLAALSGIDPELQEAAYIDGAAKMQRIWHIDLPGITPTIIILLIFAIGSLVGGASFEKVLLLQNFLNMDASDILETYIYRIGLTNFQYSYASAVGFFTSAISFILLILANFASKKLTDTSLW